MWAVIMEAELARQSLKEQLAIYAMLSHFIRVRLCVTPETPETTRLPCP